MNSIIIYLIELNIALVILFLAYKLFFEKDKNFVVRRIYLLGVLVLPFILPLIPETIRMAINSFAPVSFSLEEITIYAYGPEQTTSGNLTPGKVLMVVYLLILGIGVVRLSFHFWGIIRAILRSDKMEIDGKTLLSSPLFHASSFFGYIFIDPASVRESHRRTACPASTQISYPRSPVYPVRDTET